MAKILTFRGEVFPPPSGISLTLPVPVFCFLSGVLSPHCCFASFAELVHVCRSVATRALTNCVPRFCFSFASFLFLYFPSISIIVVGATTGVFLLFPNGFLLFDHRLDFYF